MVIQSCGCLNIKIHLKKDGIRPSEDIAANQQLNTYFNQVIITSTYYQILTYALVVQYEETFTVLDSFYNPLIHSCFYWESEIKTNQRFEVWEWMN